MSQNSSETFDLIVIGAGPGGYVAAIRAAQLGMNVACVEEYSALGGTCLNVGCIPSKALLESSEKFADASKEFATHGIQVEGLALDLDTMMARKNKIVSQLTGGIAGLFKKNKVTSIIGRGRLLGEGKVEVSNAESASQVYQAKNILIATGSVSAPLPGVDIDHERIGTSTDALAYPEVPKQLVVIGAGVIGLELGSVWARLGSKVTVLEYMPTLLPGSDPDVIKLANKLFKRQGMDFKFGVKVTAAKAKGDKGIVEYEDPKLGVQSIEADRVLLSVGRRPNTKGLGATELGIESDKRGCILVNDHFETNIKGIWAIGDVVPGPMLAHKAEEEGIAAVECMAGLPGHLNYDAIPSIVYTHPEIASVGKSEAQLKQEGVAFKTGKFPFAANGRAKALGESDGFVKIIADEKTDRILGAQVIGARAGDLIAELAVAMEFSASSEDIARSVHAHPTMAEAVKEAALDVSGRVIHL